MEKGECEIITIAIEVSENKTIKRKVGKRVKTKLQFN